MKQSGPSAASNSRWLRWPIRGLTRIANLWIWKHIRPMLKIQLMTIKPDTTVCRDTLAVACKHLQVIFNETVLKAFILEISNKELQSAVRMAGKSPPSEALAFVLTRDASEQAFRITYLVREAAAVECHCKQMTVERQAHRIIRCWNCNRLGHLFSQCYEPRW